MYSQFPCESSSSPSHTFSPIPIGEPAFLPLPRWPGLDEGQVHVGPGSAGKAWCLALAEESAAGHTGPLPQHVNCLFSDGQHHLAGYTGVSVSGSPSVGPHGSLIVIKHQTTQETFKHPPPPPRFHFVSVWAQPLDLKQRQYGNKPRRWAQGYHQTEHTLYFNIH